MALGNNLINKVTAKKTATPLVKKDNATSYPIDNEYLTQHDVMSAILDNQKLSKVSPTIKEDPSSLFLAFDIEKEQYAIPIHLINEILPSPEISILPQQPNYILGLVNVRGEVYTLLDLALKFSKNNQTIADTPNYVLVIQSDYFKLAIALQKLPVTIDVKESEIEGTEKLSFAKEEKLLIKGIVKKENSMIIYLDILKMINHLDIQ